MRIIAAVAAVLCVGVVSVEARASRRAAPAARRAVSRFLATKAQISRPFSDFEGEYCVTRASQFMQKAAAQNISSSELPPFMGSLCQTHLCHFKRTSTVYQVDTICNEVTAFFQSRADKDIAVDEGVRSAAHAYCKQLQEEVGPAPSDVGPLLHEEFECPLEKYMREKRQALKDAEQRREEEDSTADPTYVVAAASA